MAISQTEFDELKKDHDRLRALLMTLIPIVGCLLEKAGADPEKVAVWQGASPKVGFEYNKWSNSGLEILRDL
ncbi:hypothetical protein [Novosphingobium sp. SG707]|uniref:hypothetical protein n=1 Tax=Novosphingobium sp. SG707 TaxID=2586996 RepID=UPI0014481192|nr:hypothetical protein [Novosphingobium sp. SG707]NKJ00401.1 hypothetical protein [Novosphingobium sp. SG707]